MKITFLKGKNAGESHTFAPPGVFIGREADNDIQLMVDGVSQYHAKILFSDREWVLHDLDSSNGTKVNGNKIKEPTHLNPGDMIHIGSEALKIEFNEKKTETPSDIPDLDKSKAVKIRNPAETKKDLPCEEKTEKSTSTNQNMPATPKKSKEQRAKDRDINRLVQEALREKKKRLTIISIIIAVVANALIFLWWFSRYM